MDPRKRVMLVWWKRLMNAPYNMAAIISAEDDATSVPNSESVPHPGLTDTEAISDIIVIPDSDVHSYESW